MNLACIYVVCVTEKLDINKNNNSLKMGCKRIVGWFPTFKMAEQAVMNNTLDINETVYNYAIIEEIYYGLYPLIENDERWYYMFDVTTNTYIEIKDVPENYKNYLFPIGEYYENEN